jgi:hypothetical protein
LFFSSSKDGFFLHGCRVHDVDRDVFSSSNDLIFVVEVTFTVLSGKDGRVAGAQLELEKRKSAVSDDEPVSR